MDFIQRLSAAVLGFTNAGVHSKIRLQGSGESDHTVAQTVNEIAAPLVQGLGHEVEVAKGVEVDVTGYWDFTLVGEQSGKTQPLRIDSQKQAEVSAAPIGGSTKANPSPVAIARSRSGSALNAQSAVSSAEGSGECGKSPLADSVGAVEKEIREIFSNVDQHHTNIMLSDIEEAVKWKREHADEISEQGDELMGHRTSSGRLFAVSKAGDILFMPKKRGGVVGAGTFKKVYHALWIKPDRSVTILADGTVRSGTLEVIVEDESAADVPSDHVVSKSLFRVGYKGSQGGQATTVKLALLQPLATFGDLRAFAQRRDLLTEQAQASMMWQLADGLMAIHGQGFIHRDLKPANVFIYADDRGFTAKIADLGFMVKEADVKTVECSPAFLPPEAFVHDLRRGGEVARSPHGGPRYTWDYHQDRAADVYALGMTFKLMLDPKRTPLVNRWNQLGKGLGAISGSRFSELLDRMTGPKDTRPTIDKVVEGLEGIRQSLN